MNRTRGMIDPMQDLGRAIDLWIGELARKRLSPRTRDKYRRHLNALADSLPPYTAANEITTDDCRRFLDRWLEAEASTIGGVISCLRGFFRFLIDEGHVPEPGPMHRIQRPRRKRAEDLDVITISSSDAYRMLFACEDWQEMLCIASALYTGRRRAALNAARRADVDLDADPPTIRFREKGDKVIVQPLPAEYETILRAAAEDDVWGAPGDYLIPSRRPATVTRKLRKDSLIWDTVRKVAERAGVDSHVHALRAAFAVQYDDTHPRDVLTLKDLLGHIRLESTLVYLRRRDKARGMEAVRDLSWAPPGFHREGPAAADFPANALLRPIRDSNPCSDDPERPGGVGDGETGLRPSLLELKVAELRARDRERREARR